MMVQLVPVRAGGAAFARFTYSRFQPLLETEQTGGGVVGVGALAWGKPVGLALAAVTPDRSGARVLSIAVAREHQRAGIGTALLAGLEQALTASQCGRMSATYLGDSPSRTAIEKLSRRLGWEPGRPEAVVYVGKILTVVAAWPWSRSLRLPHRYRFAGWSELTSQEREAILNRSGLRLSSSEALTAGAGESRVERNSVALRYDGAIVGWQVTHRILPDTIRYSDMFVREDLRQTGRGVAVIAESLRRHAEKPLSSEAPTGMFHVRSDNAGMLRFVQARMAPSMESITTVFETSKQLVNSPGLTEKAGA